MLRSPLSKLSAVPPALQTEHFFKAREGRRKGAEKRGEERWPAKGPQRTRENKAVFSF